MPRLTQSDRAAVQRTCRQGRDTDGSEFGPCEFCEKSNCQDSILKSAFAHLRWALNATDELSLALDALENNDPNAPGEMAVLRASLDYWTRHLGRDNDEIVERDSVRVAHLREIRNFRVAALALLERATSTVPVD